MNPLNILVVYDFKSRTPLESCPSDIFSNYNVTLAHSLTGALRSLDLGIEFDVVLCDLFIPAQPHNFECPFSQENALILHSISQNLEIAGFGLLLPRKFSLISFESRIPKKQTYLVCNESWTPMEARDWIKLLHKLLYKMSDRMDIL